VLPIRWTGGHPGLLVYQLPVLRDPTDEVIERDGVVLMLPFSFPQHTGWFNAKFADLASVVGIANGMVKGCEVEKPYILMRA